jgi:hypothetical protein
MKKWMICLLALVLVLAGCDGVEPQQTTLPTIAPTTAPPTEPVQPIPSLYVPGSDLEKLTRGSVQVFVPEEERIGGYGFMGEDIVLFTYGDEFNRAMRISGADGTVLVDTVLEGSLNTWGFCTSIGENRMVFYDETDMCCVILDGSFQEIDRVALPEELAGIPLVSSDLSTVYYQVGDELRALNLSTGIPRLVLKLTGYGIYPSGLLMNDTVINCYVVDENGNSRDEFFSTETGESLGWDEALLASSSWDDRYMILRYEGAINRIVLGDAEGNLQEFVPEWDETQIEAHPCADALTQITYQENGIRLSAYEMETGNRRATVMLPGVYDLYSVHEDPTGEYIWCVVTEPGTGREMLARWDYTKSGGADSVQRIGE